MKHLLILTFCFAALSCSPLVKIKGTYQTGPHQFTIDKPIDHVWSKAIDIMTDKGYSMKTIDKASGVIVSETHSLRNVYTYENESGFLNSATAYVVIPRARNGFDMTVSPDDVTAHWSLRIKELGKQTSVSINLTNIKSSYLHPQRNYSLDGKSTGVFEKWFASELGR